MEETLIAGLGAALLGLGVAWRRRDLALSPLPLGAASGVLGAGAGALLSLLAPGAGWAGIGLLAALAPLALIDARRMILPDDLTLPLILFGLLLGLAEGSWAPALGAALGWGGLALFARLWPREGALGGGDAKLLGGIGACLGPMALPEVVFIAALSGLAFGLAVRGARRDAEIPFGPALAFGALGSLLFGPIFG